MMKESMPRSGGMHELRRSQAKQMGLEWMGRLGIFLACLEMTKRRTRILMYHRFSDDEGDEEKTPRSVFEEEIGCAKKRFRFMDMEEYLERVRNGREVPHKTAIVTVDDGYRDFYEIAYPALRKHAVPATVFLTTDFIDGKGWLWTDIIRYALKQTTKDGLTLEIGGRVREMPIRNEQEKRRASHTLGEECKTLSLRDRTVTLEKLLEMLRVELPARPTDDFAPLTWAEVIEMHRDGISFGAHTCSHPILTRVTREQALYEIAESKRRIKEKLGRQVVSFCYPNGLESDYDAELKGIVETQGFWGATTAVYGMNGRGSDRYELRRIPAGNGQLVRFVADMSGFTECRRFLRSRPLGRGSAAKRRPLPD
jgi:peptidoglycan/xylan/chitin deacetylase (PgdA/CDA1 family)